MPCPHGHDKREAVPAAPITFDAHAATLRAEGIGPESRMCFESILESEIANPSLAEIHAAEGEKFIALARRIAPPQLAAQYIREVSVPYPTVASLNPALLIQNLKSIMTMTERGIPPSPDVAIPGYQFPAVDTERYLNFCGRDPNLFLACLYFSVSLQTYVMDLNDRIARDDLQHSIGSFGRQFDSKNLTVVLPVMLCRSLCKLRGEAATTADIDKDVMLDALTALHNDGVFTSTEEGRGPAGKALKGALQCPMEGYLFELLVKHQALEPIIAAISRANYDLRHQQALASRTVPQLRDLFSHGQNFVMMRELAQQAAVVFQQYRTGRMNDFFAT
jgi:hypothetical protein